MQSILDACPEEVESVTVEADGTWHSEDARYGTSRCVIERRSYPEKFRIEEEERKRKREEREEEERKRREGKSRVEVVLDSDDDETKPGQVAMTTRVLGNGKGRESVVIGSSATPPVTNGRKSGEVITISDSEDEGSTESPNHQRLGNSSSTSSLAGQFQGVSGLSGNHGTGLVGGILPKDIPIPPISGGRYLPPPQGYLARGGINNASGSGIGNKRIREDEEDGRDGKRRYDWE
jgi:hypothetical protein